MIPFGNLSNRTICLYWTELNIMFTKLLQNKDLVCLRYLEIKCGIRLPGRYTPSEQRMFCNLCKLRENLIQNVINIALQTTIKSICILPLKLNKSNIDLLKFWFCQPFGEFVYQEKQEMYEIQEQYPTLFDVSQCLWKYKLFLSRWNQCM